MPLHCPKCGMNHDVKEFARAKSLRCRCGFVLNAAKLLDGVDDFLAYCESEEEREKSNQIQKDAQEICLMILNEEFSYVDIEIAKSHLRSKVEELFPDKVSTYEMIYESRFDRLWDQFRSA